MPVLYRLMDLGAWQNEVGQFVGREVIWCASTLVGELVKLEQYTDDLLPVCVSEDWIEAAEEESGEWAGVDAEDEDRARDIAREFCEERGIDPHVHEAYEHWIVSDWLANKLEERGEMVIRDFLGLTIWGRCTTGQAICMDHVINAIYYDLMASEPSTLAIIADLDSNNQ